MELFRIKKDIPFMSYGRLTTSISLITFVLAIFFLLHRGLNYGVDFTGGTVMEVHYPAAANIEQIRRVMDGVGLKDVTVQNFGSSQDVLIRLPVKKRAVYCTAVRKNIWRVKSGRCRRRNSPR